MRLGIGALTARNALNCPINPMRAPMNNNKTLLALCLGAGLLASGSTHAFWFGSSGYTQTKYPVVLSHGMLGFVSILGIDY